MLVIVFGLPSLQALPSFVHYFSRRLVSLLYSSVTAGSAASLLEVDVVALVSSRPPPPYVSVFVRLASATVAVFPKISSIFSGSSHMLYAVVIVIGSLGTPLVSAGCFVGSVSHKRPAHSGCFPQFS